MKRCLTRRVRHHETIHEIHALLAQGSSEDEGHGRGDRGQAVGHRARGRERRGPGETLGAFRVARIVEAKKHPNADKLQVVQVEVEKGEPLMEVVCGAPNARAGLARRVRAARHLHSRLQDHTGEEARARRRFERHDVLGRRAGAVERKRRHHRAGRGHGCPHRRALHRCGGAQRPGNSK